MKTYEDQNTCRVCNSENLRSVLDLGKTHLADGFFEIESKNGANELFPLILNVCINCGWHQLSITVNPALLYVDDYPYDSRTTDTGRKHWEDFAKSVVTEFFPNKKNVKVLDIGSNTGALLSEFKAIGCETLGIDPSHDAAKVAYGFGIENLEAFFDESVLKQLEMKNFSPDVITSTNSFAHTDDLRNWLKLAEQILINNGVLVIEAPHALELFQNIEYDTIYHEHLSYLSIAPLISLFEEMNLPIFHVEKNKIHGGSVRIYASKRDKVVVGSVSRFVQMELASKIYDIEFLEDFALKVASKKVEIKLLMSELQKNKKRVGVVSAPAKGMTFLSYNDLTDFELIGISDKNPMKIGKYAPGTGLRVVSDEDLLKLKPDYLLILAWNFKDEIIKNLRNMGYRNNFIVGIPDLEIINA